MAIYGYVRVSTTDQDLSIQVEKLTATGCTVVREEKVSGTSRNGRNELETLKIINYGEGNNNPFRKVAFPYAGKHHLAKPDRYRPLYGAIMEVLLTLADGSERTIKAVVKHDQETPRRPQGDLEKRWKYSVWISPLEDVDGVKCLYGETIDLRIDGQPDPRWPRRRHPCLLFVERKRVVRILGEDQALKQLRQERAARAEARARLQQERNARARQYYRAKKLAVAKERPKPVSGVGRQASVTPTK
jgi:hypothetical protein